MAKKATPETTTTATQTLQYIPIEKISPHPQNPRKDLGDLSELTENIKVNGILQNLTVVPRLGEITKEHIGFYTVVVGHRRLAAAKLAGLSEVPCIVADMTEIKQLRTMLSENMQRSDLTVYEQAQGFQTMLDLGDTVEEIAERAGFSETTVRRRVKLLELDQDKFIKAEARGATLFEYAELDKLKSLKAKNKVLEYVGTENFRYRLREAIDAETKEERKAAYIAALSEFATQISNATYRGGGYWTKEVYYLSSGQEVVRPSDADQTEYFFCVSEWGGILLLQQKKEEEKVESEEQKRRKELMEFRLKGQQEVTERAHTLRGEFAKTVSAAVIKKHLSEIAAAWIYAEYCDYTRWIDQYEVEAMLGVELAEGEGDNDDEMLSLQMVAEAIGKTPETALFRMIYMRLETDSSDGYYTRWRNEHRENEHLDIIYKLLTALGYEMSDDEKAMQDGTHELFGEGEDEG